MIANVLELALLYELSESYVVGMPLFLRRGIFGALAGAARCRGHDPEFSRYTKPDGAVGCRTRAPSGTGGGTLAALTAMLALLLLLRRPPRREKVA